MKTMAATYGPPLAFGLQEMKPMRGFPPGKVRIRQRNNEFAQAFVKTPSGVRHYFIEEVDGFWQPTLEQARKIRA